MGVTTVVSLTIDVSPEHVGLRCAILPDISGVDTMRLSSKAVTAARAKLLPIIVALTLDFLLLLLIPFSVSFTGFIRLRAFFSYRWVFDPYCRISFSCLVSLALPLSPAFSPSPQACSITLTAPAPQYGIQFRHTRLHRRKWWRPL